MSKPIHAASPPSAQLETQRAHFNAGQTSEQRRQLEQQQRLRRILDAAIELAERGGYEAVRLRDVADTAGVAIATLYRYVQSKEALLAAAMDEDFSQLEAYFRNRPAEGETAVERVMVVFKMVTRGITQRPNYGRALLRAVSYGQLSKSSKTAVLHNRLSRLLFTAIHPTAKEQIALGVHLDQLPPEQRIAGILDRIWFSSAVGWAGGILDPEDVLREVESAAKLLLLNDADPNAS